MLGGSGRGSAGTQPHSSGQPSVSPVSVASVSLTPSVASMSVAPVVSVMPVVPGSPVSIPALSMMLVAWSPVSVSASVVQDSASGCSQRSSQPASGASSESESERSSFVDVRVIVGLRGRAGRGVGARGDSVPRVSSC